MSTIVLIAILSAAIYGLSKIVFPSPDIPATGNAEAEPPPNDLKAKADAMIAKWRHDYVGKVYEGDAGHGSPERIVIADVELGSDGPVFGVAFNPERVDGKLVYGTVYHYSMASFGEKFGTWKEVQP
jgi:hypothetical protein